MTKQEWIIKNDKPGVYVGAYREGLAKGLEICIQIIQDYETYSLSKEEATIILEKYYLTENEKNNVDKNS